MIVNEPFAIQTVFKTKLFHKTIRYGIVVADTLKKNYFKLLKRLFLKIRSICLNLVYIYLISIN